MDQSPVPAGYMRNAQGHLVPLELVKPIDQERDRLVRELVALAKDLNARLVAGKSKMFGDVAAFVELSAEQYGVKRGGLKGNVTLSTYDGAFKLQIATAENVTFDERLQAAKTLIDECINEWAKGSRPEIMVLVQQAFQTDKEGNLNVGRILGLRRLEIGLQQLRASVACVQQGVKVQLAQAQPAHIGARCAGSFGVGAGQGGAQAVRVRVT